MNSNLKTLWVSALRSGKYKQGDCYLQREDSYCCLGVLCEVAGFKKQQREDGTYWFQDPNTGEYVQQEFEDAAKSLGISQSEQKTLILLNDSMKCSFDQIALFINNVIRLDGTQIHSLGVSHV